MLSAPIYRKLFHQTNWHWKPESYNGTVYVAPESFQETADKWAGRPVTVEPMPEELVNLYKNGSTPKKNQYGQTLYDLEPWPVWGEGGKGRGSTWQNRLEDYEEDDNGGEEYE